MRRTVPIDLKETCFCFQNGGNPAALVSFCQSLSYEIHIIRDIEKLKRVAKEFDFEKQEFVFTGIPEVQFDPLLELFGENYTVAETGLSSTWRIVPKPKTQDPKVFTKYSKTRKIVRRKNV